MTTRTRLPDANAGAGPATEDDSTLVDFRAALEGIVAQPDGTLTPFEECSGRSPADVRDYRFRPLLPEEYDQYDALVRASFTEARIFSESFLPDEDTRRYGAVHVRDGLVGTCSFRDASHNPVLVDHLGKHLSQPPKVIWEVNNFAVAPDHRNGTASALLLIGCALSGHRSGVDALAGVIRSTAIPALTNFGLVPTYHEPLHILGRDDVCDFISYYDTREEESVMYMRERAARFFYSAHVIYQIRAHARKAKSAP
jgi:hypothetical protein